MERTGRRRANRAVGLGLAATLIAVGAWQVAQPTDAAGDDLETVAGAPDPVAPATRTSPDVAVDRQPMAELDGPGEADAAARTPPRPILPSRTPTPEADAAPVEAARIVATPVIADPTSLSIPSLDVTAPVDRVALEADGSMEVPDDIARVGWYAPGVRPGETGSAVIAGHVDSRTQGRGALWGLQHLDPGDTVTVGHDDGQASTWRVTTRTSHVKEQLPIGELFTRFGERRLVLITCGGSFDAGRGRYTHNIVVIAEPVEPAA